MADRGMVPLAETVRALRGELWESIEAAEDEQLRFALGPVELEFQVAVE